MKIKEKLKKRIETIKLNRKIRSELLTERRKEELMVRRCIDGMMHATNIDEGRGYIEMMKFHTNKIKVIDGFLDGTNTWRFE